MQEDYVVRVVVEGTEVLGYVASSTRLVERARRLHRTTPVATAALGRALTLVGILGVTLKENQRVSLQIECRGPLEGILVQGNAKGEVRGYVSQPWIILPSKEEGKLNVEDAVGAGSKLVVVKDLGFGEPYLGSVTMPRGGIAYDLAYYFTTSEQLPSACSAGVYVSKKGKVLSAGGFIIHTPSGTSLDVIDILEENIARLGLVSQRLFSGETPEDIAALLFDRLPYRIVGKSVLRYCCRCSRRRAKGVLLLLGEDEREELFETQGKAEVHCAFCNRTYVFVPEDFMKKRQEE